MHAYTLIIYTQQNWNLLGVALTMRCSYIITNLSGVETVDYDFLRPLLESEMSKTTNIYILQCYMKPCVVVNCYQMSVALVRFWSVENTFFFFFYEIV